MLGPRDRLPATLQAGPDAPFTLMKPLSPRSPNQALGAMTVLPRAGLALPAAAPLAGLRVLLTEDNEVNVIVAMAMLGRLGLHAEHVATGEQAVQRALEARFDIVLTDLQMPGMTGHAACTALRTAERERNRPRVPVVAMTAHLFQNESKRMSESGMDGYSSKPFDTADLVREITRVLGRVVV